MKKYVHTFLITAAIGVLAANAEVDCVALSQTVTLEISAEKSQVLAIVSKHISASPDCACEVVKSAIKASEADDKTVALIVRAAATSAPEQIRLISQCAIATAPRAMADIMAVLAELDRNSGESVASSKDAKDAKAAEVAEDTWNPLDFPGKEGDEPPVPPTFFDKPFTEIPNVDEMSDPNPPVR